MARCSRYMKEIERKKDATCLPLGMRRRRRKRKLAAEEPNHFQVDENEARGEIASQNTPNKAQGRATPPVTSPMRVPASIKINPLFLPSAVTHTTASSKEEGKEEEGEEGEGGGGGEVFYSQQKNIRRTKEKEMIAAVVELAKYGEKTVGPRNGRKRSKLVEKVRGVALRRTERVGKHKSPTARPNRGRAFYLRAPLRSTQQL